MRSGGPQQNSLVKEGHTSIPLYIYGKNHIEFVFLKQKCLINRKLMTVKDAVRFFWTPDICWD